MTPATERAETVTATLRASNPEASTGRKAHAYDPDTNRSLCGREISGADRYAWRTLGAVDCERCLRLLDR